MMLFVLCTIMCNILEQSPDVVTATQSGIVQETTQMQTGSVSSTTSSGTTVTAPAQFMEMASGFFNNIGKIIFWDYSFSHQLI